MRKHLLYAIAMLAVFGAAAQPSLEKFTQSARRQAPQNEISITLANRTQAAVRFDAKSRLMRNDAAAWLSSSLSLRAGKDGLRKSGASTVYRNGIEIDRYQQYYNGIKVEHGVINVTNVLGKVAAMQLEFYPLDDAFETVPRLSADEALKKATGYVGASRYAWEGYTGNDPEYQKPKGELVIVEDYYGKQGRLNLAYKFEIIADQPLSRSYVYVSAANGALLLVDRVIKHIGPDTKTIAGNNVSTPNAAGAAGMFSPKKASANTSGTAQTRYSGTQSIVTDNGSLVSGKPYRLRQVRNGHAITTLNYQQRVQSTTNNNLAVDFTDNDNNWTTAENSLNYDDAALDVQFAMQFISDYWKNVHNRNSWDNAGGEMRSYVHIRASASAGYDNAYWGGSAMYY